MPTTNPILIFIVIAVAKASCGPAMTFYAKEKELLQELNITPEQHCAQFHTKHSCNHDDEYTLCKWCDTHKPDSDSENQSARCVPASYHWFHCERAIAPPRERIKHKFEWGKKKEEIVLEGVGEQESDPDKLVEKSREEL
eukprot:CCRYP_005027-RA/>CCRYP_005027-RA protein AED:0.00 eAED:0.00 QI:115/1/1/1/1/1/2/779/139